MKNDALWGVSIAGVILAVVCIIAFVVSNHSNDKLAEAIKNYRPADCIHGGWLLADPNSAIPKEGDIIELRCMRTPEGQWQVWGRVKP